MNDALLSRLVLSFESIAQSLSGLNATKQKEFAKQWPEPKPVREAVVTHIPTEEDKILEAQGVDGTSLQEWLSDEEFVGEREREFLEEKKRNAGAQGATPEGPSSGSPEEAGSEAGTDQVG